MKEKIMNKALELFSVKGFDAVSVSMISDGLGLSKAALYKHYESKRDIFDSIVAHMEEKDFKLSQAAGMPSDMFDNIPEAYKNTGLSELFSFSLSMFVYWTEDEFASRFRKMLCIERFSSPEMDRLYQKYLGSGPLDYVRDLFKSMEEINCTPCSAEQLALEFYAPMYMLMEMYDSSHSKLIYSNLLTEHFRCFTDRLQSASKITYPKSKKYCIPELMQLIMGPNPIKLEEELLENCRIKPGSVVCDLGCGKGLTSIFLANEYGCKVYAADLWIDPKENSVFFESFGFSEEQILPVKADAMDPPFEPEMFDAVVSVDSYNYFGRDRSFLSEKLLPYVKHGGYIYIAIPGMKTDCHDELPEELLLSWNAEQLDFLHDKNYWHEIISHTDGIDIVSLKEMRSNTEVWNDWLMQDNEYAVGDRKSMEAGAGKYLNFIQIILRKK